MSEHKTHASEVAVSAASLAMPFWQGGKPDFLAIRSCADITGIVERLLASHKRHIAGLVAADNKSQSALAKVQGVEKLLEELHRVFAPVRHLHAVADEDKLRAACNACLPKISAHHAQLAHNEELYQCYRQVADDQAFAQLPAARRKAVQNALRDFRLGGIDLPASQRQRYSEIEQRLAELQMRFEQNVTDATDAFGVHISDESRLDGLSHTVRDAAKAKAEEKGVDGWIIGLHAPFYQAVLMHANDSSLRQQLYLAWNSRASSVPAAGPDNAPLMEEVVALCQEQAELLGFESYAHYALQTRMAQSPKEILSFLRSLADMARPVAESEIEELRQAADRYGLKQLQAWDLAWVVEKLRRDKYDLSQDELRLYFPVANVIQGLFMVVSKLFGIDVREGKDQADVWHGDVRFYEVHDGNGAVMGGFYMDLYARDKKRGGAWMDDCRTRTTEDFPLAFLTCNFTPPTAAASGESLLNHDEVVTLFHEFGHTIHHLLTKIDLPPVAGINGVPWDAVEFPSQFLENWCWQEQALAFVSSHHETGTPLDHATIGRMLDSRNFQAGRHLLRQIELAMFDLRLYLECKKPTAVDIQQLLNEVRSEVAVFPVPRQNCFQNSFSHIFAGGYAAGYYSYLWAEVLAADAFSRFSEEGVFSAAAGRDFYDKILSQGGVRDPGELFVDFRGRKPDPAALPTSYGLLAATTAK